MGFNNFKADGSTTAGTRRGALSRTSDRAAASTPSSPHKMPLRVEGSASDSTRTSRGPRDGMLMLCPFCSELVPKARAAAHLQTIACQARAHEREEEVLRRQQEAAACSDEASECETEEAVHARGQDIGGHTKNCGRQWPCEPAAARSVDDEARARPWFAFGAPRHHLRSGAKERHLEHAAARQGASKLETREEPRLLASLVMPAAVVQARRWNTRGRDREKGCSLRRAFHLWVAPRIHFPPRSLESACAWCQCVGWGLP